MQKTMKMVGGVALLLVAAILLYVGVMQFLDAEPGTRKPGKLPIMAGALSGVLGVGLIGNAMGKIKV